jgi:hypothetical protein
MDEISFDLTFGRGPPLLVKENDGRETLSGLCGSTMTVKNKYISYRTCDHVDQMKDTNVFSKSKWRSDFYQRRIREFDISKFAFELDVVTINLLYCFLGPSSDL